MTDIRGNDSFRNYFGPLFGICKDCSMSNDRAVGLGVMSLNRLWQPSP